MADEKGFDGDAYFRALKTVVESRNVPWKQVSLETGVSASTLARMAQGRRPDAASLASLSAWAGLNPSHFVAGYGPNRQGEAMGHIASLLRSDPNLDSQSAEAMEAIVRAAYERLRKQGG